MDILLRKLHEEIEGFVRQRENLEGYMEKSYISYESFYYSSEYIKQVKNTLGAVIWFDKRGEDKREGEILEMNGKRHMIKRKCRIIICQITTQ